MWSSARIHPAGTDGSVDREARIDRAVTGYKSEDHRSSVRPGYTLNVHDRDQNNCGRFVINCYRPSRLFMAISDLLVAILTRL